MYLFVPLALPDNHAASLENKSNSECKNIVSWNPSRVVS